MNTSQHEFTESQRREKCTNPALQAQLFDYIAELLSDEAQEEVEDHLLDCQYCREFFLMMLNVRSEARRERILRSSKDDGTQGNVQLLRLADFRQAKPTERTSSAEAGVVESRIRLKS